MENIKDIAISLYTGEIVKTLNIDAMLQELLPEEIKVQGYKIQESDSESEYELIKVLDYLDFAIYLSPTNNGTWIFDLCCDCIPHLTKEHIPLEGCFELEKKIEHELTIKSTCLERWAENFPVLDDELLYCTDPQQLFEVENKTGQFFVVINMFDSEKGELKPIQLRIEDMNTKKNLLPATKYQNLRDALDIIEKVTNIRSENV